MSEGTSMDRVHPKAVWGAAVRIACAALLAGASASCGQLTRQGQASSYLILTSLEGASGATPGTFSTVVLSDVVTVVNGVTTFFNDLGQATVQLALKDPTAVPNTPSTNNFITITQYHVQYARTDGRNTPGVDVPYAFDGAMTTTVSGSTTLGFTLVRNDAKLEPPLLALRSNNIPLTTIATVTFYGHDQTGREVSVSGNIEITFANFGDQ